MVGADLLWEKNTAGWLVLVTGAGLVWDKNTVGWMQMNRVKHGVHFRRQVWSKRLVHGSWRPAPPPWDEVPSGKDWKAHAFLKCSSATPCPRPALWLPALIYEDGEAKGSDSDFKRHETTLGFLGDYPSSTRNLFVPQPIRFPADWCVFFIFIFFKIIFYRNIFSVS